MTLFVEWLEGLGHDVVVCRDPGTTAMGETVREILLGAEFRIDFRSEMLLYMACRAQLVDELVRPALADGKVVVSDRYVLANVVYQGCAGGLDPNEIWDVGKIATNGLMPNLTFVLDLDPQVAAARVGGKQDRLESRGLEYFTKVRDGFIEQAGRFSDSNYVVDASLEIEQIQSLIREATTSRTSVGQPS